MFHRIKTVTPLPEYKLRVQFFDGTIKIYSMKTAFEKMPVFKFFIDYPHEFHSVTVDVGGYGIVWNDDLDLSCDELWENGVAVSSVS